METIPRQSCVRCGQQMVDIKGSRMAVCSRCGYKDDCC
jgi:DNA-directed RNA polymerase subunit RPC12/RpoP